MKLLVSSVVVALVVWFIVRGIDAFKGLREDDKDDPNDYGC